MATAAAHRVRIAGRIEDGVLLRLERDAVLSAIRQLPPKTERVVVTIAPLQRARSLRQNAYWWAVVVPLLAEHCGYTPTQMHYALLGECFGYIDAETVAGRRLRAVPVEPSSSALTVEQFTHLIEWVLTWAPTELGVVIPEPNEALYDDGVR